MISEVVDVAENIAGVTKKGSLKPSNRLEEFLKLMDEENLQELEVVDGDFSVKLVRQSKAPVAHYAPPAGSHASGPVAKKRGDQAKKAEPEIGSPIKSPLAGVFYRAPSPNAALFVKEGDIVTPDKTLCIIEAMKVLNEINAGVSGKILKIMVENGKPVSSGQTLFLVEPS